MTAANTARLNLRVTTTGVESFTKVDQALGKTAMRAKAVSGPGGLGGIARAARGALPALAAIAGPAAIAGVVLGLGRMATGSIKAAAEIGRMSTNLGLPISQIASLAEEARLAGTDMGEVEGAVLSFNTALGEAAAGDRAAAEAFENLGVAVVDLNGNIRDSSEVLPEAFEALSNMDSAAMRADASMLIFGESVARLTPIINKGTDAFTNQNAQIGEEFVKNAQMFTQTQKQIGTAISGVGNILTAAALPAFQSVADAIFDVVNNPDQDWTPLVNAISSFGQVVGDVLGFAIRNFGTLVGFVTNAGKAIVAFVQTNEIIKAYRRVVTRVFTAIINRVVDFGKTIGAVINGVRKFFGQEAIDFSGFISGFRGAREEAEDLSGALGETNDNLNNAAGGGASGGGGGGAPAVTKALAAANVEAEKFSGFLEDGTLHINGQVVAITDLKREHFRYLDEAEREEALRRINQATRERQRLDGIRAFREADAQSLVNLEEFEKQQATDRKTRQDAYETELEEIRVKHQEILDLVGDGADPETILGATAELAKEVENLDEKYGDIIPTIGGDTGSVKASLVLVQTETEGVIARAETLEKLFGTTDQARGSIRSAIAGLIRGTHSWGEALQGLIDGVLTRLANALAALATNSFFNLLGIGSGAPGLGQAFGALRNAVTGGGPALSSAIPAASSAIPAASFLGPAGAPGAVPALSTGAAPLAAPGAAGPAAPGLTPGGVAGTVVGGVALGAVIGGGVTAVVGALTRGSAGTLLVRRTEQQAIQEAQGTVDRIQELAQQLSPYELAILNQPRVGGRVEEQRRAEGRVRAANPDADEYSRLKRSINENLAVRFTATRLGLPPDQTGRVPADRITTQPADRQRALDVIRGLIDPTKPYARGGIVRGPTNALIGEAGPEAVVPLSGGRTIPVEIRGGGAGNTININISLQGGVGAMDTARNIAQEIQSVFLPGGLAEGVA